MQAKYFVFVFFLYVFMSSCSGRKFCEEKLNNCTAEIQPVLNEVRYMFPTTHMEIEGMCKIWSHIMDCIRKYMVDCSTDDQKTKFNEAVSDSVDSVHAICSSDRYRGDYLEHAHCLKRVSTESCGMQFKKMVESAYSPMYEESHVCCAYSRYEKCVSEPIQRMCGPQTLHMLDHSMSSLKSRCEVIGYRTSTIGKDCHLPDPPPPLTNDISSRKSPRLAPEQSFDSISTPAYSFSEPSFYTTPPWAPRTVIYPMPVTRYSSRIAQNKSSPVIAFSPILTFSITLLAAMAWMVTNPQLIG